MFVQRWSSRLMILDTSESQGHESRARPVRMNGDSKSVGCAPTDSALRLRACFRRSAMSWESPLLTWSCHKRRQLIALLLDDAMLKVRPPGMLEPYQGSLRLDPACCRRCKAGIEGDQLIYTEKAQRLLSGCYGGASCIVRVTWLNRSSVQWLQRAAS